MNELWNLIEAKAASIARCSRFLEGFLSDVPETEPEIATVKRILAAERDHLAALKYLCDTRAKDKADTATADFARDAVREHREAAKLIK